MQVVKTQPTGAYTTGSNSVGAVIFDKPQYDPLTITMKMGDDLQRWADKKEAKAAKEKAAVDLAISDLDFDKKGIFDRDEEYFTEGKNKLIDAQTKLYQLPHGSPEWRTAFQDARKIQSKYGTEAQGSKSQKEMVKVVMEKYSADPKKYDGKRVLDWYERVREANNPVEREVALSENPLVAPKIGLVEATNELLKAAKESGAIREQVVKREWGKAPNGETTQVEYTELMPEQQQLQLAKTWITKDNINMDTGNEFTGLGKGAIDYYTKEAVRLSNTYGAEYSPIEVWYANKYLNPNNSKSSKETGMGFSPREQEEADLWGRMKDEERQGAYTLIKAADAFVGKPEMLRPGKTEGGMDATMVPSLVGLSMGKTADGKDDPVLSSFRTADGKIHVMTASSYEKESGRGMQLKKDAAGNVVNDANGKPIWEANPGYKFQDTRAYRSYDNVTQFWNAVNKPEGVGNGALRYADSKKARSGDGVSIDAEKLVGGMTPEQKAKQDAIYNKKVEYVQAPGATSAEQTLGGKVKVEQPKGGGASTYTIKGKKYTLKQLTDMGYTEAQVAPYKDK